MTDLEQIPETNGSAAFRFLSLTDHMADELKKLIPGVEFGRHHETDKHVGCVLLDDPFVVMVIEQFRREHAIKVTDCDVFISIYSDKNDEIWRAPKTVNYVINVINCPIVFSFTSA